MSKNNLKLKASSSFYQVVGVGGVVLALIVFLSVKLYPKIILIIKSLSNKLETVCGCTEHMSFVNHPVIFSSLIVAGILIFTFFSFIIFKTIRLRQATTKFVKSNLKKQKSEKSIKLQGLAQALKMDKSLIEIADEKPIIFCFGLLKSKICISSGLINKLTKSELKAVLLHEKYHLLVHDPMRLFLVKLIARIIFFIPGIKYLSKQYIIYSELAADEYATNNFRNKTPLVDALYRIIEWEEQLALRNNLALSFFSDNISTDERINKLADNKYTPRFKFVIPKIIISAFVIFSGLFYLNGFISINTEVNASGEMQCLHMAPKVEETTCHVVQESECNTLYYTESIPTESCG